jgi:hypothetical protein
MSFPQAWLMIFIVSYFEFLMHVQEDLDNSLHRASRDQQKPNPVVRIGETQVSHLFVWLKWQIFYFPFFDSLSFLGFFFGRYYQIYEGTQIHYLPYPLFRWNGHGK